MKDDPIGYLAGAGILAAVAWLVSLLVDRPTWEVIVAVLIVAAPLLLLVYAFGLVVYGAAWCAYRLVTGRSVRGSAPR